MIDTLLETLLKELHISQDLFLQIVDLGIKTPSDRRVFEQLLACESFQSFKKLMISRNKEIDVEVVKSMKTEGITTEEDLDFALEKQEIAEVGYALAMSIAWEEEQRRKAQEAEEDLARALRESEADFKMQQERGRREEDEQRRQREERDRLAIENLRLQEEERQRMMRERERLEQEERKRREEAEKKASEDERRRLEIERLAEEARKREEEEIENRRRARREQELEEERRREEIRLRMEEYKRKADLEMQEKKKKSEEEAERLRLEIEALNAGAQAVERNSKPRMSLIPMQNMNLDVDVLDLDKGRIDLTKELQEAERLRMLTQNIMKNNGQGKGRRETVAERDEKLLKQRELILAKKKLEREQEMQDFRNTGGLDLSQEGIEAAKDTGGFSRKRNSILDAKRASFKEKKPY